MQQLLADSRIAYVQGGNEPNIHDECQENQAFCQPGEYHKILAEFAGHGKFISAPWAVHSHLSLVTPWDWAQGILGYKCPKNIGIHAYADHGGNPSQLLVKLAEFLIGLNFKYIYERGCKGSKVFVTETNATQDAGPDEWAAARAVKSGVEWINGRVGWNQIQTVLLFSLGPTQPASGDTMTVYYLSLAGRGERVVPLAMACGNFGELPGECNDSAIPAAFEAEWNR